MGNESVAAEQPVKRNSPRLGTSQSRLEEHLMEAFALLERARAEIVAANRESSGRAA